MQNKDKMWIRSQDKKKIVQCKGFAITANIGGKKKKALVGTVSNGFWGERTTLLGLYATEEEALNELTEIQNKIITHVEMHEMS